MTLFKKFSFLLSKKQKKQFLFLVFLMLLGMIFEMLGLGLLIPVLGIVLNSDIANSYPVLAPVLNLLGNPTQNYLIIYCMTLLVTVYIIKTIYLIFLAWKQSKFMTELFVELGESLFLGYLTQPYKFHLQRNSAELLRNIQNEIGQFTTAVQAFVTLISEISVIIGIAVLLIFAEPVGAISITFFLALMAFVFHRFTKNKLTSWGETRQHHAKIVNQHLLQGLGGVKDVKLLGRERYFLDQFAFHNRLYAGIQLKTSTLSIAPRFYLELLAVFGLAGLILIMVFQNKPLDLLIPTIGIFVAAAFRMIPSMNRIMSSFQIIRFSKSTLDLLLDEINLVSKKESRKNNKITFKDELEGIDISFTYNGASKEAIDKINIIIRKGQCVGLIGESGSGKSTLVDLILGLLEPVNGELMIGKQNMKDCTRNWQDKIGYVPQAIYLIDESIKKNIAFGIPDEQIDNDAVLNAVIAAQLDEFVNSLPEKLETFVGERGVRLSGGQRQRIGIARALYHDPEVLVLDEATSALDSETEKGVMEAVNALQGVNKTIIIVAHRLSTVEQCDYIYRLDKGKVIEEGTPEVILKSFKIIA